MKPPPLSLDSEIFFSLPPLVLASRSPRRKEILTAAGFSFEVVVSGVDEHVEGSPLSRDLALIIARRKSSAVAPLRPSSIVLAADTVVALESGEIFGIPRDRRDSARMLAALSGRTHLVHTAVVMTHGGREFADVDTAAVTFRVLSEQEKEEYVRSGEGDDKAGAYAFQGKGRGLVNELRGDFQTVIGLPLRLVRKGLAEVMGIPPSPGMDVL